MPNLQPISLTDDQLKQLKRMAVLGYTPAKMAMYLDVDPQQFKALAADETSEIHYRINQGILQSEIDQELGILEAAEKGSVTASQQLSKIQMAKSWAFSRADLMSGPEPEAYHFLEDYLQSGSVKSIPQEEEIYLQALELIANMSRKFGRKNTELYFVKNGLSSKRASQMYDEAISLFWVDHGISKKAYRNMYADQLEEAARQVLNNLNSSKDADVYGKLILAAAKVRELDKEDPKELPAEVYTPPVRVYTLDVKDIDMPEINRNELAKQIDELPVSTADKHRLKKDALLESVNLIETWHGLKEESKED